MMARSVADLQSPIVPQADRAPNWSSASDVTWRLHKAMLCGFRRGDPMHSVHIAVMNHDLDQVPVLRRTVPLWLSPKTRSVA